MLTLFHHPMFASSRFVRLAFGEYGEELALIEEKPWTRRKEFLALNPAGTLPVLLAEGDVPIVGAPVIAEYLDETRGVLKRDQRLLPKTRCERAEIRRLIDWFLVKFESEVTRHLVRERVLKPHDAGRQGGGSPDSGAIRAARANIRQHLKYINWLAGTRNWLAGTRITYADLAAAARHLGARLSRRDRLARTQRGARMVHAGQVAALLPAAARRPGARPVAGVALCGPRLLSAAGSAVRAARLIDARGAARRLRRGRRHRARCHPAGAGRGWRDFVADGHHGTMDWMAETLRAPRRPARALAGGALDRRAGDELRAGPRSARACWPARDRGAISVYARTATITT